MEIKEIRLSEPVKTKCGFWFDAKRQNITIIETTGKEHTIKSLYTKPVGEGHQW